MSGSKKQSFGYLGLLLSFAATFILIPIFEYTAYDGMVVKSSFTFIALFAVYTVAQKRSVFLCSVLLALIGIVINWIGILDDSLTAQVIKNLANILLFTCVSLVVLINIFRSSAVDNDTIYGSICVYLFLGVIWALCFTTIEIVSPGSFSGLPEIGGNLSIAEMGQYRFHQFFYFSYVTLTTLGYGNISPISSGANALAAAEAIIGQLFLTILIARLVALHIMQRQDAKK